MKKIGIDARMYRPGATGIGRYIDELIKNITKLDSENEYHVYLNKDAYENYEAPADNVQKIFTSAKYYSLQEQINFLKDLNNRKFDLVHFTHFNAPIFYKKPLIVTIHDLTLSKFPGQKMNSPLHRLGYHLTINFVVKHASHIISVSNHTKKDLVEMLKIKEDKVTTIYEGISDKFYTEISKQEIANVLSKYGIDDDFILYVGVWRNHKNLVNLIEAFSKVVEKFPNLKLILTGKEDSKHYPEVRNAINQYKLNKSVITPGFVPEDDLLKLYRSATALVNPSFYEGFGFPPLEAMAQGTAAIISDASCHKEICRDAALYFDPYSVDDIADKISKLVDSVELRNKLIRTGNDLVKEYTWQDCALKTLDIYKQCL